MHSLLPRIALLLIVTVPVSLLHASPMGSKVIKKGIGSWGRDIEGDALQTLNVGWYYSWAPVSQKNSVGSLEFVPMFWNQKDVTPQNIASVEESKAICVLGFNEPDRPDQAAMSVDQCLELWPKLMRLKQRLGSPAPANSKWLEKFMPEAKKRGLRVDFICVHRYPDFTKPGTVGEMERWLWDLHRKYDLPIWLTEFGSADVKAWKQPQFSKPNAEGARKYLETILPVLERLPFVERYAWFADRTRDEYALGSLFHSTTSELTPMGEIYRNWPSKGSP